MDANNINAAEIAETRRWLILAGYKIIPVAGKIPRITGWQNINAGPEDALHWPTMYPDHTNTSVLAKNTPAIDIDILIGEAADDIESLVRERFGSRGAFLSRFGNRTHRQAIPQLGRRSQPSWRVQAGCGQTAADHHQRPYWGWGKTRIGWSDAAQDLWKLYLSVVTSKMCSYIF
jgi:hypothetical protein